MRSLLITYDFPPLVTGIGTVFYNLYRLMSAEDNLILAPRIRGYREIDKKANFRIYRYVVCHRCRILRTIVLFFLVPFIIIKEKVDLLICAVPVSIGLIGLIFKKIANVPYCVFCYGGEYKKFEKSIIKKLLVKILENSRLIIANSEFTSQQVERFGIKKEKIFKVTPAVDADIFKPDLYCADLKKNLGLGQKKVLLTVSRLVKRKGIDTVISALTLIKAEFPDVVYLVVGSGIEEEHLRLLVKEKNLEENVVFLGGVSIEELPKFYNLCDIYVMPNRETQDIDNIEGFGLSFIEASACAKPVIGGASGGSKEAIEADRTGLLVDPEDFQLLAKVVIRLLKDEIYARELGRAGRQRVEIEFNWRERAEAFREKLDNLI
ncbi:MAG: glycosyltransferase family 4 protein [Candidatus Omnitrophota bacterium]